MIRDVIFVESASEMGGVEFSTVYLASHLHPNIWNVLVVCPVEGKLTTACRNVGVKVEILPISKFRSTSIRFGISSKRLPNPFAWMANGLAVLISTWHLKQFLQRQKPDLVLTKGLIAHFYGGLAAKWAGVKCIWHVQDFISERWVGVYRRIFGLFARILADHIVVDGTPIAMQLPENIQNRVSVIFNGVDVNDFKPGLDGSQIRHEFSLAHDDIVIGNVARITPWKGQHFILDAFAGLADRYPHLRLLFVGASTFDDDRYEKYLRSRTAELGLNHKVIFTGFRSDLPEVLSSMDIFAYSSVEKDTSPLALLSAMASGLPIVAFDIPGIHEVLNGAGLLVPVANANEMASALENVIAHKDLLKKLGNFSRTKAVSDFGLDRYVNKMALVFAHCIGN